MHAYIHMQVVRCADNICGYMHGHMHAYMWIYVINMHAYIHMQVVRCADNICGYMHGHMHAYMWVHACIYVDICDKYACIYAHAGGAVC